MSLKGRIYFVVAILIAVAVAIGTVGIVAMSEIYAAMEREAYVTERVSQIKDIRSNMQDVLIGVREIVIASEADVMAKEMANIDKIVKEKIDPQLGSLKLEASHAETLRRLQEQWTKHKKIVKDIYDKTYANTSIYATRMATGDSLRYWLSFEAPLRRIYDYGMAANSPEGQKLAMTAIQTIEAMKSVQLQEKLMILEDDQADIEKASTFGQEEVNRYAGLLNQVERMLTNPKVSDAELKAYSDTGC